MKSKSTKFIFIGLGLWLLYLLLGGVLIHSSNYADSSKEKELKNFNNINGKNIDKVELVDGSMYSGIVRYNMLKSAKDTIDISYYTIHDGKSTDMFMNTLIKKADEGVKIRVLFDGIFHNMRGDFKPSMYLLSSHPNIELKFYEPLNLLKPWTLNNRLHDKTIIIDDKLALIGGRNIGDKYFVEDDKLIEPVRDRDALIYNDKSSNESIIHTMKDYYNFVWNHEYSKYPIDNLNKSQTQKMKEYYERTEETSKYLKNKYTELNEKLNWDKITYEVENIEFVHNPIERLNKQPWALNRLYSFLEKAEDEIIVQSPYVLPTKNMLKEKENYNINNNIMEILTNSYYSSPNPPAISGYYNIREELIDSGIKINEYQGEDSIHGKSYIIDNKESIVGSFNYDARSAYLSTESYVIIKSERFAKELKEKIYNYKDNSLEVGEDYEYIKKNNVPIKEVPKIKNIMIKIISKFVYFFDYML